MWGVRAHLRQQQHGVLQLLVALLLFLLRRQRERLVLIVEIDKINAPCGSDAPDPLRETWGQASAVGTSASQPVCKRMMVSGKTARVAARRWDSLTLSVARQAVQLEEGTSSCSHVPHSSLQLAHLLSCPGTLL